MSWPTWSAASAPIPSAMAAPVQSTIVPTAINSAPAVMPPGLQYSPEQWAQAQQQNWQQWAQWQQQYQQWHQQYGAEYQKSLNALQGLTGPQQPPLPGVPNTGVPPPLPTEPKPPLPPEDPPLNQPMSTMPSYSTMPPKPVHPGYSTVPPPVGPQLPLSAQASEPFNQRQNWQSQPSQVNQNKRPFSQGYENEPNKRPLLERPKQWGNQPPNVNQWTNQPPPNVGYNQPPPQAQPQAPPKPNIEELSEAEKKFDKEFAVWESQFNKWKEQNASHPDKTQYLEYEKKWESWRNSLLERREQMRRKRLAMSGAALPLNKPPAFTQMPNIQQPISEPNRAAAAPIKPPLKSPIGQQVPTADLVNNPPSLSNTSLPHQNDPLTFKSSQVPAEETGEDFLKPSFPSAGGIPGLDLVKDDENEPQKEDVIELDIEDKKTDERPPAKGPDLDAISKGINSILGDQKLLSMLSMVSQNPPSVPAANTSTNSISNINPMYPQEHNFSAPPPPHQFSQAPPGANFSAPPPTYQFNEGPHPNLSAFNDHSNHSFEERSNQGENYQQHESVTNFDDQTRSSFTMGPNDQDTGFNLNNFSRNQLHKPPPNRFGMPPLENERGVLKPNLNPGMARGNDPGFGMNMPDNRNKFGPSNFGGNPPDNRNKFGPNDPGFYPYDNRNKFGPNDPGFGPNVPENRSKFGPIRSETGPSNFPKNTNLFGPSESFKRNEHNKGNFHNESYNRVGPNNRQGNFQNDSFSDDNNYNKYGERYSSVNDFRRNNFSGANNFDDTRGKFGNNNFNRGGSFSEQNRYNDGYNKNKYNQGDCDDYENYNEDDDYEKYHEMFNDDDETPETPTRTGQGQQMKNQQPLMNQQQMKSQQQMMNQQQMKNRQPMMNQQQMMNQHQMMNQQQMKNQQQIKNQQQGQAQQFLQRPPPPRPAEVPPAPPEPVPVEEPIFEPASVIDYDHKSLKSPDPDVVIEPLHMFDYRHKPLNRIPIPQRPKWLSEAVKFIREFDPLASRATLNFERVPLDRYRDLRADRRPDDFENRNRINRRSFSKEKDHYEREPKENDDVYSRRERRSLNRDEVHFDREPRDYRSRFEFGERNNKNNEDNLRSDPKLIDSKEFEEFSDDEINFENNEVQKHQQNREDRGESRSPILSNPPNPAASIAEIALIEDIINPPGRFHRPPRIVIILRGPPGSGKTYLAKLIKDKEVENGGSAPRILSLDDYFMVEHEKEVVEDGKKIKVKEMVYEYEAEMEESYRMSFIKSFKKTITDGYFPFIIVDNVNDKVKYFGEMWSFAKQNGFQVYICQLDLDPAVCTKRNIHNRNEAEIEECIAGWEPTPSHHPTIDASGFLQSIPDVEMEEVEQVAEVEPKAEEVPEDDMRSKWDTFDCSINNLAKLDGVSKPLRPSRTMEEYLHMEDEWEPAKPAKPGQKRVRWADLEEQREQKKMRAIGFIVGHTNWDRMMDPSQGSSALTRTKYI